MTSVPGIDGLELQRQLNQADSRVPIIFVTAHNDGMNRLKAMRAGALDFFRKPFDATVLLKAVQMAVMPRMEP